MDCVANFRNHTGESVDNVLLEWILAFECKQANSRDPSLSRVQSVYPLFTGHHRKLNESNSLHIEPFDFYFHLKLPDIVPVATIAKAKEILISNGIESFTEHFETCTVRSFMGKFKSFLGMKAHDCKHRRLVSSVASAVNKVLQEATYSRPSSRVATRLREEVISATTVNIESNDDSNYNGNDLEQWLMSVLGSVSNGATSLIDRFKEEELTTVNEIKSALAEDLLSKEDIKNMCKESKVKIGNITKIMGSLGL